MPSQASYRSGTPISGFTGHIPGSKWQVGKRQSTSNRSQTSTESEKNKEPAAIETEQTTLSTSTTDFLPEPTKPLGLPFFQPSFVFLNPMSQQQPQYGVPGTGMATMPMMMSPAEYTQMYNQYTQQAQGITNAGYMGQSYGFNGTNGFGNAQPPSVQSAQNGDHVTEQRGTGGGGGTKSRSKSVPRKIKTDVKDLFGGIESGWWSEGQALKNLRRHQLGASNGNLNGATDDGHGDTVNSVGRSGRSRATKWSHDDDDFDVPAPGYSGHVPGIKQYGVGKPFTVAAKDARRIMHAAADSSGRRSTESKAPSNESENNTTMSAQNYFNPNASQTFMSGFNPYAMMPSGPTTQTGLQPPAMQLPNGQTGLNYR